MEITDRCKTKYPIILVHGFGARDDFKNYWGRIPLSLMKNGATVYLGGTDGNAGIEHNGKVLKRVINGITDKTNCGRVNIIAHSKGGLDARYMISSLGMAYKTASLVTLSTPHRGSETMDKIFKLTPECLLKAGSRAADIYYKFRGDKNPETYKAIKSFTTFEAESFNKENPDSERVYYESYAFIMNNALSDLSMAVQYSVVRIFDGENDGLVAPRSARWTNFKGIYTSEGKRGISHNDIVALRERKISLKNPKGYVFSDITEFYISIAEGLKNRGL